MNENSKAPKVYKRWSNSDMLELNRIVNNALTTDSGFRIAAKHFNTTDKSCAMALRRFKAKSSSIMSTKLVSTPTVRKQISVPKTKENRLVLEIKSVSLSKGKIIVTY